jgi:hypothetical protein
LGGKQKISEIFPPHLKTLDTKSEMFLGVSLLASRWSSRSLFFHFFGMGGRGGNGKERKHSIVFFPLLGNGK